MLNPVYIKMSVDPEKLKKLEIEYEKFLRRYYKIKKWEYDENINITEQTLLLLKDQVKSMDKLFAYMKENTTVRIILFSVLSIVAILLNIYMLISTKSIKNKKPNIKIAICLTVVDLITLITGETNEFLLYILNTKQISINLCWKLLINILYSGSYKSSMFYQTFLTVNHQIMIVWPLKYHRIMTGRNIRILLIIFWVGPIIFEIIKYSALAPDGQGLRGLPSGCYTHYMINSNYVLGWIFFLFGFLFINILIYVHIIEFVRYKKYCWDRLEARGEMQRNQRNNLKTELKTIYTTAMMLCTFIFSWAMWDLLITLMNIFLALIIDWDPTVVYYIHMIKEVMFILKLIINFVIYSYRTPEINKSMGVLNKKIRSIFFSNQIV